MENASRILVTGSADGLGLMAAKLLMEEGHSVVLHARSKGRVDEVREKFPEAKDWVIGDLASIAETKSVAGQVSQLGIIITKNSVRRIRRRVMLPCKTICWRNAKNSRELPCRNRTQSPGRSPGDATFTSLGLNRPRTKQSL
jgi:hypothetical protein